MMLRNTPKQHEHSSNVKATFATSPPCEAVLVNAKYSRAVVYVKGGVSIGDLLGTMQSMQVSMAPEQSPAAVDWRTTCILVA